jgi:fucokinase
MIASTVLADFDASIYDHKETDLCLNITNGYASHIKILRSYSTRKVSKDKMLLAINNIINQRRKQMGETPAMHLLEYSHIMERLALSMHELCVADSFSKSLDREKMMTTRAFTTINGRWVMSMAPSRIDLAGGWSDTPPICYEFGGSVTGMAVLIDGYMPLSCRCRVVPEKTGILLRSEIREGTSGSISSSLQTELSEISQLGDFRNPLADCALIKSALIVLGLASEQDIQSRCSLQCLINDFCMSSDNVRLEIVSTSLLPQGSGMGTSSILGGCALGAIAKCVGIGELDDAAMVHSILILEQLLSSGGGWQDQVHGIIPGIKTVRSRAAEFPMDISIEKLMVEDSTWKNLEKRLILAFTGKTRLAKNILQNVLRRWARGSSEIVEAVNRLVSGSELARTALLKGDLTLLGKTLSEYAILKILMAGEDSVVEPKVVRNLVAELSAREMIMGSALCGAGGGGFLIMLASEGHSLKSVSELVENELAQQDEKLKLFTWHECRISDKGLTTHIIEGDDCLDVNAFKLDWQKI